MRRYELTETVHGKPAHTVVYHCLHSDWGLCRDDERALGEVFVFMTLNADGSYPGFTVPQRILKPLT